MSRYVRSAFVILAGLSLSPARTAARQTGNTSLDSLLSIEISSAARYAQTAREAPASMSIVTREDIERFGYRTLAEAIATLRGFYLTSDRTYTYLGVRGFGRPSDNNNRVLLLVDGVPFNSVINGEATLDMASAIPIEHVERIEVARGPGSALYGSNAMLATVNVVTRRTRDGGPLRVRSEVDGNGAALMVASVVAEAPGGVELDGFAQWYDNPGADLAFPQAAGGGGDGTAHGRDYTDHRNWMLRARVSGLGVAVSHRWWRQGDPTAPYGSIFDSPDTHRAGDGTRVDLVYETGEASRVGVRVEGGYQVATARARFDYRDPFPDRLADVTGRRWGGEAQVRVDLTPSNRVVVGSELRRWDPTIGIGSTADPLLALGEPIDLASVYVQDEMQPDPSLALVAGARVDRYSRSTARVTPRLAVVHHPASGTSLKVLLGEAFRAPTPLERFTDSPPLVHHNEALEPEHIRTLEIVWEQRLSASLQGTISWYDYHLRGLIAQEPDVARGGLSYQNVEHIDGYGAGADITGRFPGGTTLFASIFVQRSEREGVDPALPNSPDVLARLGGTGLLPGGVRLGVHASFDAARATVHGARLDPVTLVNANVQLPAWGPVEASVSVSNLFDRHYLLPGGTEHSYLGIPQEGRLARFSLSARF